MERLNGEWAARDWMAAFSFWRPVASMAADGEAALFAVIAARLANGEPPDMMENTEEALERLTGERGFHVMTANLQRGGGTRSKIDPDYFDRLERSRTILMDLAETELAQHKVTFLMDCLYDAFDLGTGRALAGGERAMLAETSSALH